MVFGPPECAAGISGIDNAESRVIVGAGEAFLGASSSCAGDVVNHLLGDGGSHRSPHKGDPA